MPAVILQLTHQRSPLVCFLPGISSMHLKYILKYTQFINIPSSLYSFRTEIRLNLNHVYGEVTVISSVQL